jgi:hypothetical protein
LLRVEVIPNGIPWATGYFGAMLRAVVGRNPR